MENQITDEAEVLDEIGQVVEDIVSMGSSIDEEKINAVPYKDSWTAAQLIRHVTKSVSGIAGALEARGVPAQRDPGQRIPELKKTFLDFSTKLNSPEFIVPEPGPYEKTSVIEGLQKSFENLKQNAETGELNNIVDIPPLGPITKWEMLHFTLYHSQRHLHQMGKISDALEKKSV